MDTTQENPGPYERDSEGSMFREASGIQIHGGIFNAYGSSGTDKTKKFADAMALLSSRAEMGAPYDAAAREDAPKCHEHTRVAIINDVHQWAQSQEPDSLPLMWIYGPGGSGKTTIMQTVAETFDDGGRLAASFFFSTLSESMARPTDKRNFVITLAYQLSLHIPALQQPVADALSDTSILTKSLFKQLDVLIIGPLNKLAPEDIRNRCVFLVDGLDECNGDAAQRIVLAVLERFLRQVQHRVRILVASRPLSHIRAFFSRADVEEITRTTSLDNDHQSDNDIRTYVISQFWSIRNEHPESGRFNYASLIMKMIADHDHHPDDRLQAIISSDSVEDARPYEESQLKDGHRADATFNTKDGAALAFNFTPGREQRSVAVPAPLDLPGLPKPGHDSVRRDGGRERDTKKGQSRTHSAGTINSSRRNSMTQMPSREISQSDSLARIATGTGTPLSALPMPSHLTESISSSSSLQRFAEILSPPNSPPFARYPRPTRRDPSQPHSRSRSSSRSHDITDRMRTARLSSPQTLPTSNNSRDPNNGYFSRSSSFQSVSSMPPNRQPYRNSWMRESDGDSERESKLNRGQGTGSNHSSRSNTKRQTPSPIVSLHSLDSQRNSSATAATGTGAPLSAPPMPSPMAESISSSSSLQWSADILSPYGGNSSRSGSFKLPSAMATNRYSSGGMRDNDSDRDRGREVTRTRSMGGSNSSSRSRDILDRLRGGHLSSPPTPPTNNSHYAHVHGGDSSRSGSFNLPSSMSTNRHSHRSVWMQDSDRDSDRASNKSFNSGLGYDRQDDGNFYSGSDDDNHAAHPDAHEFEPEGKDGPNVALTLQALHTDGTLKRPMNAFMIFARYRRPQVSAENPAMRTEEITLTLSREWLALSSADKQIYLEQAKQLEEVFESRYPGYVYRPRPRNRHLNHAQSTGGNTTTHTPSPVISQRDVRATAATGTTTPLSTPPMPSPPAESMMSPSSRQSERFAKILTPPNVPVFASSWRSARSPSHSSSYSSSRSRSNSRDDIVRSWRSSLLSPQTPLTATSGHDLNDGLISPSERQPSIIPLNSSRSSTSRRSSYKSATTPPTTTRLVSNSLPSLPSNSTTLLHRPASFIESQFQLPSPSAVPPGVGSGPWRRRVGFWNRRGDHLTADGYVVFAPYDCTYPLDLRTYPLETEGYQDEFGNFSVWAQRPELPESLPRFGRKPEKPYDEFVIYCLVASDPTAESRSHSTSAAVG